MRCTKPKLPVHSASECSTSKSQARHWQCQTPVWVIDTKPMANSLASLAFDCSMQGVRIHAGCHRPDLYQSGTVRCMRVVCLTAYPSAWIKYQPIVLMCQYQETIQRITTSGPLSTIGAPDATQSAERQEAQAWHPQSPLLQLQQRA